MAGAAVPEPSGKGKKKALDSIVNVVPFIDLLSCCLAFLLITAVWTQVGRLQVAQSGGPPEDTQPPQTLVLTLGLSDKGYTLASGQGGVVIEIPKKGADFDVQGLGEKLKDVKAQFPDQRTITVSPEDAILFNDLVVTIDTCVKMGLDGVTVQAPS
jgi:biopolymer transport protein ExbD